MLRKIPRVLVARFAPLFIKQLLRSAWRRVQHLRTGKGALRYLFVFGGRTEYWSGIGRDLYAREPAFRAAVQECDWITTELLGGPSILDAFSAPIAPAVPPDEVRLMHTSAVMQLALVDLWRASGVQADAVLGVSLGEIAAVYAAGGLTLTDALRVSACYYSISQVEKPDYPILVIDAGFAAASKLATDCPAGLYIVLVLDAATCMVSCATADLSAAIQYLATHGVTCQQLRTKVCPYHTTRISRHVATLRIPLRGLQPKPLVLPCYLSTPGRLVPAGTVLGIDYWLSLPQYPVNIYEALRAAVTDEYELLVPVGGSPFPFFVGQSQQQALGRARLLPALRSDQPECETIDAVRQELKALGLVRPYPHPSLA